MPGVRVGALTRGVEPGPAPGWIVADGGGCAGGDGFTAGCCAASGDGMVATINAAASQNIGDRNDRSDQRDRGRPGKSLKSAYSIRVFIVRAASGRCRIVM